MKTEKGEQRFLELFTGMCEMFDKKYTEVLLNMYLEAFKNFTIDQIETSINQSIVTCRFFPKPVDIIESISGSVSLDEIGLVQAGIVLKAIKEKGSYTSIAFDDPVTMAVISTGFGGWVQMCTELMVDQEKWFQKDFSKIYSAYAKQNIKHQGYLSGLHEIQNQSNGKDIKPQIEYVGDKKQMLKIAENVHGNIENSVDLSNLSNSLTKEI